MVKALVLSGGGSKGAYQAGVIKHIIGVKKHKYDIYCGVSVGALNAACLAMFPEGKEEEASEKLLSIWNSVRTKDVRKSWFPFGVLHALWKPSLYNSSPLAKLLEKEFDAEKLKTSGKLLAMGAASLTTGNYKIFTHEHPNVAKCILASSSFPTMLTPIELEGELWTDGGVRDVTPIKAAIDMGADEIDVVMCSYDSKSLSRLGNKPNTISVAFRTIEILSDEVLETDLHIANLISELSKAGIMPDKKQIKITLLRPSEPLPGESLDFERKDINKMLELGFSDAKIIWK